MLPLLRCFFAGVLIATSLASNAQVVKVAPFKPPVVKSTLGKNGNNALITADEAKRIIGMPLLIADNSNTVYTIDSYQFLYKRKNVIEDEKTGKKATAFTTVSDLFKATPLPPVWVNNISGGHLQKDEELYFFDIVVKDAQGRKFFAPDLRLKIQ